MTFASRWSNCGSLASWTGRDGPYDSTSDRHTHHRTRRHHAALREANPEHKLDLYRSLRLKLAYTPATQTAHAIIDLGERRWDMVCVRGGTRPHVPSAPAGNRYACVAQ